MTNCTINISLLRSLNCFLYIISTNIKLLTEHYAAPEEHNLCKKIPQYYQAPEGRNIIYPILCNLLYIQFKSTYIFLINKFIFAEKVKR